MSRLICEKKRRAPLTGAQPRDILWDSFRYTLCTFFMSVCGWEWGYAICQLRLWSRDVAWKTLSLWMKNMDQTCSCLSFSAEQRGSAPLQRSTSRADVFPTQCVRFHVGSWGCIQMDHWSVSAVKPALHIKNSVIDRETDAPYTVYRR